MQHQIVSRQEWLKARIALLEREKAWTRQRDQIAAERLALPWVRIEKDYVFAGPQGKLTLLDLFQGRSQLYIKHFMMAPDAKHQCVGCSLEVDHIAAFCPTSKTTMSVTPRSPVRRSRRSKWCESAWVGHSSGSPRSAPISTTTSTSRSGRKTLLPVARCTISAQRPNGPQRCKTCRVAAFSTRRSR